MTAPAPVREVGYVNESSSWWAQVDSETTPELRWPLSVAVFSRMRREDAQVTSVLRAVTLPVRRTPWRVEPNGARDEVAAFVAEDLGLPLVGADPAPPVRVRDRFSWMEHLQSALLELSYGHSYFEQLYRIDGQGRARLRKLAPRPAQTISAVNVAEDGGLVSIEQHARSTAKGAPIPVNRLVAYIHEREGGNWLGASLLRPAYKHWLIKDRLLRVQAQTIERNGMGVPLYTGPENPAPDDLDKGRQLASAWRSGDTAGAAVPHGADLLLRGVEGDLPDANPAIRYHDEQIARAVLAHFLNLDTKGGSYALASVQAETFTQSLQTLAQQVADVATQHIVEDLVDANFGEDEPAPRIVFDEIGARQTATAQALKLLRDAGLILPDRPLEEQLRQQYGLPAKDLPSPTQENGDAA